VGDQGDPGVVGTEEPAPVGERGPVVPFGAEVVADRGPGVQLDRDLVVADGTRGPAGRECAVEVGQRRGRADWTACNAGTLSRTEYVERRTDRRPSSQLPSFVRHKRISYNARTALRRANKVAHEISNPNGVLAPISAGAGQPQCPGWLGPALGRWKFLRAGVGSAAVPVVLLVKVRDNEEELER
jgi:hypothetical protein